MIGGNAKGKMRVSGWRPRKSKIAPFRVQHERVPYSSFGAGLAIPVQRENVLSHTAMCVLLVLLVFDCFLTFQDVNAHLLNT